MLAKMKRNPLHEFFHCMQRNPYMGKTLRHVAPWLEALAMGAGASLPLRLNRDAAVDLAGQEFDK